LYLLTLVKPILIYACYLLRGLADVFVIPSTFSATAWTKSLMDKTPIHYQQQAMLKAMDKEDVLALNQK